MISTITVLMRLVVSLGPAESEKLRHFKLCIVHNEELGKKKVHLPTNRCLFGELVFMDLLCVFSSFVDLFLVFFVEKGTF